MRALSDFLLRLFNNCDFLLDHGNLRIDALNFIADSDIGLFEQVLNFVDFIDAV